MEFLNIPPPVLPLILTENGGQLSEVPTCSKVVYFVKNQEVIWEASSLTYYD